MFIAPASQWERGRLFGVSTVFFFLGKQPLLGNEKSKIVPNVGNERSLRRLQTGRWGCMAKIGFLGKKKQDFGPKKTHFLTLTMFRPRLEKVVQRKELPFPK